MKSYFSITDKVSSCLFQTIGLSLRFCMSPILKQTRLQKNHWTRQIYSCRSAQIVKCGNSLRPSSIREELGFVTETNSAAESRTQGPTGDHRKAGPDNTRSQHLEARRGPRRSRLTFRGTEKRWMSPGRCFLEWSRGLLESLGHPWDGSDISAAG